MTEEEMTAALGVGVEMALEAADSGYDLLGFGEMGIGNTTAASAIAAALVRGPVEQVLGRGAGADEACMTRKRSAVSRGLARAGQIETPVGILLAVGGLEIAALAMTVVRSAVEAFAGMATFTSAGVANK